MCFPSLTSYHDSRESWHRAQTGNASGEAGVQHERDDSTHASSQQARIEYVPPREQERGGFQDT